MKRFIWSMLLLTIIVSCTNDDDFSDLVTNDEQGGKFSISVTVEPFNTNDGTLTRGSLGSFNNNDEFVYKFKGTYEDVDKYGNPKHVSGDKFGICSLTGTVNIFWNLNLRKLSRKME